MFHPGMEVGLKKGIYFNHLGDERRMKNYIFRSEIGSGFGGPGTLEYCFIASINNVNAMPCLDCGSYVLFFSA